jgi:signal transduction histidine kinase
MAEAQDPAPAATAAELKAFSAEENTAWVRFAVIVFNIMVYWLLLYPRQPGSPPLAAFVSVVAMAYTIFLVTTRPYRHFPVLATSLWTAVTDAALILLWLHATGDYASPFHLLWFLSLFAVTFRYDWRATLAASILYGASYVLLLQATGTLAGHATEVLVRVAYVLLVGVLGSLLARESLRVFEERYRLGQTVQEAQRREKAIQAEMEVRRLREMDRFKSDFINAAAHELNTPLTPLKLQLHILKKKLPHDSGIERRTVDLLDRNLERLVWLVDEMLDVARLHSGRLRLKPAAADLARLAREAVETFQETAAQRGITLRLEQPDALPGTFDPQRVTQVLYNLVSNALKFTPTGGEVEVRARRDGAWLEASVADTGAGLTAEQAGQLFQPFTRLHRDQLDAPGTGLGLYISQGIAQRHGGTLAVRSAGPGRGATFTLRLPQAPAGGGA